MLFNNSYSLIITKGLGGPACCALLTANFSLVCGCIITVEVINAGGGPYNPVMFTPIGQRIDNNTRMVMITVKTKEHQWKKMYAIDRKKADILVAVIDFVNSVKDRTAIAVDNLKQAVRKVTATFRDK